MYSCRHLICNMEDPLQLQYMILGQGSRQILQEGSSLIGRSLMAGSGLRLSFLSLNCGEMSEQSSRSMEVSDSLWRSIVERNQQDKRLTQTCLQSCCQEARHNSICSCSIFLSCGWYYSNVLNIVLVGHYHWPLNQTHRLCSVGQLISMVTDKRFVNNIDTMLVYILLWTLLWTGEPLDTPPSWIPTPKIQTLYNLVTLTGPALVPYTYAFSSTPLALVGVHQLYLSVTLNHNISIGTIGMTSLNLNLAVPSAYSSLSVTIALIDASMFPQIMVGYTTYTASATVSAGWSITQNIAFASPITNTSHTIHIIPYLSGIYETYYTILYLGVTLSTALLNSSTFSITYNIPYTCNIYFLQAYILIVDATSLQQTREHYVDYYQLVLNGSSITALWTSQPNRFQSPSVFLDSAGAGINKIAGMCSLAGYYAFDQFTFDYLSNSLTTISSDLTQLSVSVANFRYRFCDPLTPFYEDTTNRCYNTCPHSFYRVASQTYCLPCSYYCQTCNDLGTLCFTCSTTSFRSLINTTTINITSAGYCKCVIGYFDNNVSLCVKCDNSCKQCTNASTSCLSCNGHRSLIGQTCPCLPGFYEAGNPDCSEVCGDGIKMVVDCDDGNTVSGDGCSNLCAIQANYSCRELNSTLPSTCSYNQVLNFSLTSLTVDNLTFVAETHVQVTPILPWMAAYNFSLMAGNDTDINITSSTYSAGSIDITLKYSNMSDGHILQMQFVSPNTSDTFAVLNSTFTVSIPKLVTIVPPIVQPAYLGTTRKILLAIAITNIIVYVFGGLKLAYIETIWTLQISYFCFAPVMISQPLQMTFSALHPIANGYNQIIWQSVNSQTLSLGLKTFMYKDRFVGNFNVMLMLEIIALALAGMFYGLAKVKKFGNAREILMRVHAFVLYDVTLSLVLFNILNSSFATGLEVIYLMNNGLVGLFWVNILGMGISNGIVILIFVLRLVRANQFKNDVGMYKSAKKARNHSVIVLCVRLTMGLVMGILVQHWFSLLIVLGVQIGYGIYLSVKVPYTMSFTLRAILNQATILQNLLVGFLYQTHRIEEQEKGGLVAVWIQLFLLGVSCLTSLCYMAYTIYIQISRRKHGVKISIQEAIPVEKGQTRPKMLRSQLDRNLTLEQLQEQNDQIQQCRVYSGRPNRAVTISRMRGNDY